MSEVDLNIFGLDKAGLIDFYGDLKRKDRTQWFPTKDGLRTQIHWLNREEEKANFRFKYIRCIADYGDAIQTETCSMALQLTTGANRHSCFIKFPNEVHIKDVNGDKVVKTECLLLCEAYNTGDESARLTSFPEGATLIDSTLYSNNNPYYVEYNATIRDTLFDESFGLGDESIPNRINWMLSGDGTGGVLHRRWTSTQKADIIAKFTEICQKETTHNNRTNLTRDYAYWESQLSSTFNGYGMLRYETDMIMTYDELPFPVFDYTQVDDIVKYLKTGDDSGALDVFDSNNPDKEVIDDYKTNYRVFVTPWEGNKRDTKFTVIGYNSQLIENRNTLSKDYSMFVYASNGGELQLLQQSRMEKYPTVGWYSTITGNYTTLFNFGLSDSTEHDISTQIDWSYKPESAVNIKVNSVHRGTETFSKSNIVDGYRYTSQDGTFVDVIFRAPNMDDLDGGYSPKEDHEDDKSGTDSDFSGASGLRTFSINNTDFETINKKLWSTDWASVFKSSSIDPVKCVISCKGIPFTADSVSSAEVVIANMDTGLNKNYVKSVKSFNVGSVLMPHYNDDFTDITLTHIRCYLPYIGWVELPASECISRVAYSKVGIEARPKRLKFKYIVDFVDGSVRCVVSVNDTERWFFDGNCSVDIPVTSDNHTQAVSNALRSGLQTGLSIATAVAGAYTSNAGAVAGGVIGAMQNAPNIFPTYSYTATANGSGYINASMNTHIMIVIERPNTIKSTDYAKRVGVPCGLSLNLGSLHGFTVCKEVDVTGIDATPDELAMIKSLLESGLYL